MTPDHPPMFSGVQGWGLTVDQHSCLSCWYMRKIDTVSWPPAQIFKPAKGLSHHTKQTRSQALPCLPKVKITQKPCWQSLLVFLSPHCISLFNLLQMRNARKKMFWEEVKTSLSPLHCYSALLFNNCKTWCSSWVPFSAHILRVSYSFLMFFFCSCVLYLPWCFLLWNCPAARVSLLQTKTRYLRLNL